MLNDRQKKKNLLFFIFGVLVTSYVFMNIFVFYPLLTGNSMVDKIPFETSTFQNETITRNVPIVALNNRQDRGVMGNLTLKLIPGDSDVLVETNPFLRTDIQFSGNLAVEIAKKKTQKELAKDVVLSYEVESDIVGGQSAGAATAIAAISAMSGRKIKDNVAITGSIRPDGSIGEVGGILEKAKAVADAGYDIFLVPEGQSQMRYYERVVERSDIGGYVLYNRRYVPKTMDLKETLKEEWDLELREISDIDEVMSIMLE